jgi:hypothetical protein
VKDNRRLIDLVSVGPATIRDLHTLGISEVSDLIGRDPNQLFELLHERTGRRHDVCCIDVFTAAIAQAENPELPQEQCVWHYWSRMRKNLKGS